MTRFEILNKYSLYETVDDMVDYLYSSTDLELCFLCTKLKECQTNNYISSDICKENVKKYLLEGL